MMESMYTIPSLIPFNMVLDTDFSILKLIQFKYKKDRQEREMFPEGFMRSTDTDYDHVIEEILINRIYYNPVTAIMIHKYQPVYADKIYEEIKSENEDRILALARKTALFNTVAISAKTQNDVIKFTIACDTQKEIETAIEEFGKFDVKVRCVLKDNLKTLNGIENLYVKQIADLNFYKNVTGKNIIVADYSFNLQNNDRQLYTLKVNDMIPYSKNKFHIVSIYDASNFVAVG